MRPQMNTFPPPVSGLPAPSRPARLMRLIRLVVMLAIVGGGIAGWKKYGGSLSLDLGSGDWQENLATGLNTAQATGKPALVLFTADWCPPCRELKRGVLKDPKVLAGLEKRFVLVKVDLSDRQGPNAGLAQQFGVGSIPTIIVFNPQGREVKRVTGGKTLEGWIRRKAA